MSPAFDSGWPAACFVADCRRCPRLATHLDAVKTAYPTYHAAPVPPFGDRQARLLVVGLAPGLHGANASGRPFTGDFAGILLYQTLFDFGFTDRAQSLAADDGLMLMGCRITNAVKCLPPANKPLPAEIRTCNGFLAAELATVGEGGVVIALGRIAHEAVLRALSLRLAGRSFGHGLVHELPGHRHLLDAYHCSRYNTQTRRLTPAMFRQVFAQTRVLLGTD